VAGLAPDDEETAGDEPLIEAHELEFCHAGRQQSVLRGIDLQIADGDKILLTGPSGSGKSTLASLLVGLRAQTGGILLARGLDRESLGSAGWRGLISAAPQFHENHVFADTFAFNLLMGRRWPPERGDVQAAVEVCRSLGLDELLQRMPAGFQQVVGDSGWQLSHGERSRLFMARALLQRSRLVILDESLAALDPENLAKALTSTLDRDAAFLVIAHP
jgi:ATP-binding cassette subfamily B protein